MTDKRQGLIQQALNKVAQTAQRIFPGAQQEFAKTHWGRTLSSPAVQSFGKSLTNTVQQGVPSAYRILTPQSTQITLGKINPALGPKLKARDQVKDAFNTVKLGATAVGLPQLGLGTALTSTALGGAFNKFGGGSFFEGAGQGLGSAGTIAGIGKLTNPLINKTASQITKGIASPMKQFAANRVATGALNIPEGMIMQGATSGIPYSLGDAAIDFGLGAAGGQTLTGQKGQIKKVGRSVVPVKDAVRQVQENLDHMVDILKRYDLQLGDMAPVRGVNKADLDLYPDAIKMWKNIYGAHIKPPRDLGQVVGELREAFNGVRTQMRMEQEGISLGLRDTNAVNAGLYDAKTMPTSEVLKYTQSRGGKSYGDVMSSIEKNGFDKSKPIVINKFSDGTAVIVDGNGRALAARDLGIKDVPVIVKESGLNPKDFPQRKPFSVAQPTTPNAGLYDTKFYRGEGGTNQFQNKTSFISGRNFATDVERAKTFGNVTEHTLNPKAKVLRIDAVGKSIDQLAKELKVTPDEFLSPNALNKALQKQGYDAVVYKTRLGKAGKLDPNGQIVEDAIALNDKAFAPKSDIMDTTIGSRVAQPTKADVDELPDGVMGFSGTPQAKVTLEGLLNSSKSADDDINIIGKYVNDAISNQKGTSLKAARAAIQKEINQIVGANGNYKADYATLQMLKSDPDIGPRLNNLEDAIIRIDQYIKNPELISSSISSDAIKIKDGKIKIQGYPTQTEIKNRAEINAGNPDLYTQRSAKLEQVYGKPEGVSPITGRYQEGLTSDEAFNQLMAQESGKLRLSTRPEQKIQQSVRTQATSPRFSPEGFSQSKQTARPVIDSQGQKVNTSFDGIVNSSGFDVKKKVGILDIFRTPDRVLSKMGLRKEAYDLRRAHDNYVRELPGEIDKITQCRVQVLRRELICPI